VEVRALSASDSVIRVEGLTYSYGGRIKALNNVSFTIKRGEVVSIVGPNGSGKTTLLKCLLKILKPLGAIYIDGRELGRLSMRDIAKLAGYVPQEHHPVFTYRVIDFVLLGRVPYHSMFSAPSRREVDLCLKVLESLGIRDLADRPYTSLSGGQAQLVLVARALAQGAKILLLDEPTAHLDFSNQVRVLSTIRDLVHSGKVEAAVMTLHDPNQAMLFSDKIALLKNGELVAYGAPEKVLTPENLSRVYELEFTLLGNHEVRMIVPKVGRGGRATSS